jgi:hypothetical protein
MIVAKKGRVRSIVVIAFPLESPTIVYLPLSGGVGKERILRYATHDETVSSFGRMFW